MNESEIELGLALPPHSKPTVVLEPGKGPLDIPAALVPTEASPVLSLRATAIGTMRDDQVDTAFPQAFPQRIAVVSLVGNQTIWATPGTARTAPWYTDRAQCLLDEGDLCRRGGVNGCSERNTFAVDHHHALRSLAALRLADCVAPFFADAKVASAKVSCQLSQPRRSSSRRKARQTRTQVPSSSQRRSRRQQVEGEGYSSGKSRQRAPVFKTQRIPSRTSRLSRNGRPRLFSLGSNGSIRVHCSSVSILLRGMVGTSHAYLFGASVKWQDHKLPL